MKRKYIDKYSSFRRHISWFFWEKCDKCHMEFRRENGFKAITPPYYGFISTERYLCESCAPSFEIANDYFLNERWIPKRPKCRPPKSD